MRHAVGVLVVLLSLGLAANAAGASRVIYGVNDGNFSTQWTVMAPRMAPLGAIQVGLWVRYRCATDSDDWLVRGLPRDLGQVPNSQPVFVQLLGSPSCTPKTASERRAYARTARRLVRDHPNIRELQVWNEPDLAFWNGTTQNYVALLASVHDALRGSHVKLLGPGFSPNGLLNKPYARMDVIGFAQTVRHFYLAHHRRQPILDGFSYHPYWGFDRKTTSDTARTLNLAWRKLPQRSPKNGLRFWWTETGAESVINAVPASEFGPGNGYYGASNYWPDYLNMMGGPAFQANRVALIAREARSQRLVVADFNFQLGDDHDLGRWQSGLYYLNGEPKPAFHAFREAIRRSRECALVGPSRLAR